MTSGKENAYKALQSNDIKLRNMAIVYLDHDYDIPRKTIAEMCGLATATVRIYAKKFVNLLEEARKLFNKVKKYVSRRITESTRFFCYIDKITMPDGSVWTKIGQTTQTPEKRAKGFSWTWNGEKKVKPSNVEVLHVIECKDETSMTNMEDLLRVSMTSINPNAYCKQDRLLEYKDNYLDLILGNKYVKMGLEDYALAA